MRPMTRAQDRANWTGHPSLCDRLIASTLRALAMLVSIVARLFRLPHPTQTAECDGDPAQTPEANDVLDQFREAATTTAGVGRVPPAATRGESPEALTLIAARGTPPLGKGRSEHASRKAKLATGGDHFVPRPQALPRQSLPRPMHEVIPTPTSLRESRTSPFQVEVNTATA